MPGAAPGKKEAKSMYPPLKQKLLLTSAPTSQQSHTAVIDCIGYDRLALGVYFSSVAQTSPEITLKIGEGDTTSAFTDIEAFTGGSAVVSGTSGFVFPAPPTSTEVAQTMQFDIDLRHRKRYLKLTVTPFTTKTIISFSTLGHGAQGPLAADGSDVEDIIARISG
jgi:hypothetical protein